MSLDPNLGDQFKSPGPAMTFLEIAGLYALFLIFLGGGAWALYQLLVLAYRNLVGV